MSDAKYLLKVDIETSAPEAVVEVPGLGAMKNGTTVEVSEELAQQFKNMHSVELIEANLQQGFEVAEAPAPKSEQRKGKKTEEKGDD